MVRNMFTANYSVYITLVMAKYGGTLQYVVRSIPNPIFRHRKTRSYEAMLAGMGSIVPTCSFSDPHNDCQYCSVFADNVKLEQLMIYLLSLIGYCRPMGNNPTMDVSSSSKLTYYGCSCSTSLDVFA